MSAGLFLAACSALALAQAPAYRVGRLIDERQSVTMEDNVHPMARAEFDRGPVSADTRLERMVLVLKPSASRQAELDALVEAQHDPQSPFYHRWLTPAEYGARFGVSAQEMAQVTGWLAGHGFEVNEIPVSNRLIVFSGTAGQVADTFHTEIHRYRVDGAMHMANPESPQIPAALAAVVEGIVSLHDFRRTSAMTGRRALGAQAAVRGLPQYSACSTHYLFPADFAAIYNLKPLYSAGTSGAGTAIAIVGRSNIKLSDVAAFRAESGLAVNSPAVILVGADPGLIPGDQDESTLDVEWSGAVAPAATVKFVVGASTATSDGVDLSAQYIVNHALAPVVSTSYGSCEQEMGAAELAFYNSLWEQAASQGMSSFVASGDSGAAGCSSGSAASGTTTAVNGLCSSPYSTCVGGTQFNEGSNYAAYWASTNSTGYGSALGYIPEQVWNESGSSGGTGLWASGGGASQVYAQPSWQQAVSGTSAANGMRAVPDVALSAAGHDGYIIYENGTSWVISGTSAAAPSFAALMALVVESQGGTGQGNANAGLYPLLNAAHNPFHATPSGNNSVPGVAGFTASGAPYNLATGLGSVDSSVLVSSWGAQIVSQPPTLTLSAASTAVTVSQGATNTVSFTVTTGGFYSGNISLQVSGLPAGVTFQWSANPLTPASSVSTNQVSLTLTAANSAAVTATQLVITAAGDGLISSQTVTLQVQQASGIQLAVSPTEISVLSRSTATVTVTATPVGGMAVSGSAPALAASQFTGPARGIRSPLRNAPGLGSTAASISLISGLPKGFTATWSAPTMTASGAFAWTLTLTGSSSAVAGSSTLNLTAQVTAARTGAIYTASLNVPITVTLASPAFKGAKLLPLTEGTLRRGSVSTTQSARSLQ